MILGKGGANPQVIVDAYEDEWGIVMPIPDVETTVFASESSEDGNGQWVTLYSYDEAQDLKGSHMEKITSTNLKEYQQQLDLFEKQTIAKYPKNEQQDIIDALNEDKPKIAVGDYGFLNIKNEGADYFLAIYHKDELHTYTSVSYTI